MAFLMLLNTRMEESELVIPLPPLPPSARVQDVINGASLEWQLTCVGINEMMFVLFIIATNVLCTLEDNSDVTEMAKWSVQRTAASRVYLGT